MGSFLYFQDKTTNACTLLLINGSLKKDKELNLTTNHRSPRSKRFANYALKTGTEGVSKQPNRNISIKSQYQYHGLLTFNPIQYHAFQCKHPNKTHMFTSKNIIGEIEEEIDNIQHADILQQFSRSNNDCFVLNNSSHNSKENTYFSWR
jgi:hypothetical protein